MSNIILGNTMLHKKFTLFLILPILLINASLFSVSTHATIVEFQTSEGNFQVNLFDTTTPKTVENFLTYIEEGAYINNIVHRSIPNFIIQAGGFVFEGDFPLVSIDTHAAIINEPLYSNIRGTIAMAKKSDSVNSATSQWFFNLANNSSNLDLQNGGFTVFGVVTGDGMAILDQIASIGTCGEIPMSNYTSSDCTDRVVPSAENFVTIYQITIVDSSSTTDSNLTPVKNTLLNNSSDSSSGSSGGSMVWLLFILIFPLMYKKLY